MSGLRPRLHDGVYVYTCVQRLPRLDGLGVAAVVQEQEGWTLVLPLAQAEARGLGVQWRCRWITLEVETALSMVGLTARFAAALAEAGLSCNVVAGAHHDHLFVAETDGERAVAVLADLSI